MSTNQTLPLQLGGIREIREMLACCERTAKDVVKQPWFPKPHALGSSRFVRWNLHEVAQAIKNAPRREAPVPEPAQLKRSREVRRVIVKDGRISKVLP